MRIGYMDRSQVVSRHIQYQKDTIHRYAFEPCPYSRLVTSHADERSQAFS